MRFGLAALASAAWTNYNASLAQKPLLTKCLTGAVGAVFSDAIAQYMVPPPTAADQHGACKPGKDVPLWLRYDAARTARLCTWSFVAATPIAHYWFALLEKLLAHRPPNLLAAATKVALDQAIMTPVGICLFFMGMKVLEGDPRNAVSDMKAKFSRACMAAWTVWPFANFINFMWIPVDLRILYINVISVGFGAVMSHIQASKPVKEKVDDEECAVIAEAAYKAF